MNGIARDENNKEVEVGEIREIIYCGGDGGWWG